MLNVVERRLGDACLLARGAGGVGGRRGRLLQRWQQLASGAVAGRGCPGSRARMCPSADQQQRPDDGPGGEAAAAAGQGEAQDGKGW